MLLLAIYVILMVLSMLLLGMLENHLRGRRLYCKAKKYYDRLELYDNSIDIVDELIDFCIIFSLILPVLYGIILVTSKCAEEMLELING